MGFNVLVFAFNDDTVFCLTCRKFDFFLIAVLNQRQSPAEYKWFRLSRRVVKVLKRFLSFYIRWFELSLVYFQVQNCQKISILLTATNVGIKIISTSMVTDSVWYWSSKSMVTDLLERINHEALYFIISKDGKSGDSKS